MSFRKIINDPVYGFITIDDELIFSIIAHPWYQRLRRVYQMAMALLVYPGAVHTRLHHSLGAYHLIGNALTELRRKGIEISPEEEQAAKIAILLHDIGHGPYSHALEGVLLPDVHHETMSLLIMQALNRQFNGRLQMAMDIFTDKHPKQFLHQLISGQLDVDRMDYLTRDSFFTGVSEGVIGYDRIVKMLTVHNSELMVEEKGIYSIEKFLVSRRLMYWQVYLHKTVLCAEQMLRQIVKRARHIRATAPSPNLNLFLAKNHATETEMQGMLDQFCSIDDTDIMAAIKAWSGHEDVVLATLCNGILNRQLLKIKYSAEPVAPELVAEKTAQAAQQLGLSEADAQWLVFTGQAVSSTYNFEDEHIHILFKDGSIRDISEVDNALINENLRGKVKKYYICYLKA
jgi:uncharacterized protein